MLLKPPPVKRGKTTEAQRFARKRAKPAGCRVFLYGKLTLPPVDKLELGHLCIEDDRALVERAQKEGRL